MLAKFYIPMSCAAAIECAQVALLRKFQGYTRYHAIGAWVVPPKGPRQTSSIQEESVVVLEAVSFGLTSQAEAMDTARYHIAPVLKQYHEKEFLYVVDNRPYTIDLTKGLN